MKYDFSTPFFQSRLMGPDAVILLREALLHIPKNVTPRTILDLGGGKALSSVVLANHFPQAMIHLIDAWISVDDNRSFLHSLGLDQRIHVHQGDAWDLAVLSKPVDLVVSIDAYHYFGLDPHYFSHGLKPYLSANSYILLVVPGRKGLQTDRLPSELSPWLSESDWALFQSKDYYDALLQPYLQSLTITSMQTKRQAWHHWLATDHPSAIEDRQLIQADNGRYLDMLCIVGQLK